MKRAKHLLISSFPFDFCPEPLGVPCRAHALPTHDLKTMTTETQLTDGLPLQVRVALARAWVLALACEHSLHSQPKDNLSEKLWANDFITEDLVDAGLDALLSLGEDLIDLIIEESADAALICGGCLRSLVFGLDEDDHQQEEG